MLPPQALPFDADFFTDLGGHSLLAARFVSIVRQTPSLAGVTLQDMYTARTLRAIAALLDEKAALTGGPKDLSFTPPPLLRRFLCGLAQAICLPFLLAITTAQWLGIFVSYMLLTDTDASIWQEIASLLGVYVIVNIITVILAIATKWLVIGKFKPGRYPLWGVYYFRVVAGAAHAQPDPHQMVPGLAADAASICGRSARRSGRTPIFPNWRSAPSISSRSAQARPSALAPNCPT